MSKSEPTIIANGYSDEQLVEWMRKKLASIDQLSEIQGYRQEAQSSLTRFNDIIDDLSMAATLDIERQVQDPIHPQENHQSD